MTELTQREQDILTLLRDERDAWMQTHAQLIEQVKWARDNDYPKLADSLRVARDHADTLHQYAGGMYNDVHRVLHTD